MLPEAMPENEKRLPMEVAFTIQDRDIVYPVHLINEPPWGGRFLILPAKLRQALRFRHMDPWGHDLRCRTLSALHAVH